MNERMKSKIAVAGCTPVLAVHLLGHCVAHIFDKHNTILSRHLENFKEVLNASGVKEGAYKGIPLSAIFSPCVVIPFN